MTGFVRVLLFVIAAETAVIAVAAVGRANRERPPLPDLARLDATTRAEVLDLRSRVQPDDAVSWQDLGDVYLAFGYFAEAETCFSRAAAIGPQTHDLLLRWGVCLDRLGRLPQAIAKFEQAAEQAGDERRLSVCQYHVARCYLRDERHEEALAALKRAGDFELALYELAKLRYRLGEFEAAASVLDRLLARLPDELKLLQLRARAAAALGDTAGAYRLREQFERAKDRLFVDSTVEYIGQLRIRHGLPRERARGLKLAESGKPSPAAEALAAAQQVEWDLSTARQLVRLYFGLGRFDDATRIVQQMIDRFGASPECLEQLADAARKGGGTVAAGGRSAPQRASASVAGRILDPGRQRGQGRQSSRRE